jgi:hypothetical protein
MIRRILALLVLCVCAQAATHYVSSTTGVNSGTGPIGAPWQTLAYAMSNVAAGDTVLLLRGDVWNEALAISQNNLTIDAYGSGPAPRITGYQALTTWTSQGSNVWSAPMASGTSCSPSAGSVLFNEVVGQRQSAQNAVLHDRDFWCNSGTSIYVYAASSPSTYYGTVAAITPSGNGNSLISIAGKMGITIQHLQLDYFDGYGVYVSGTATNLTFANMSVNGVLIGENPFVTIAGSRPYGFYVATGTSATTISFVNVDAHLNYDGFRFDSYGAGSQITLTGCRAFANRDVGIFDATTGTPAVAYNYTHLYANGITTIESTDATGNVIVGSGNRPANEAPVVQGLDRFPALFSFTIDDVGLSTGTETYIDTLTPVFDARGLKMNMAATAGYNPNTTELAAWLADGHEIDSHSWSHQYYTPTGGYGGPAVLNIQYGPVGTKTAATGTAATMSISANALTTTVTGGPGGQNLSVNLTGTHCVGTTGPACDTLQGLLAYITANYGNVYTVSAATTRSDSPIHTATLATVSAQDIKSSSYTANFDVTAFWTDELQSSKSWLESHVSGLTVPVYVYPGGWNTTQSNTLAATAGYAGGRGQISMHPPGHTTVTPAYASDFLPTGRGVDVYNIISLSPTWHGLTQSQIDAKVAALVYRAKAWGVPFGLFAHNTDLLTPQEVGWILDSILGRHGQIKKNSELVTYLQSGTLVSGTSQYLAPVIGPIPSMRAAGSSPEHAAGPTVGINDAIKSYNVDILGGMRPLPGTWDIGAYPSALWGTQHGSSGTSKTTIYGKYVGVSQENIYCGPGDVPSFGLTDGPASLPQQCTYTAMSGTPSPGTVRTATSCSDIGTKLAALVNNSGDTVVIPASLGACVGTWAPTYKGDANHWLTIRTDQIASPNFPAEGVQATPCQIGVTHIDGYPDYPCSSPSGLMPTLSSGSTNQSTLNLTACNYCRVIGLNITKNYGVGMMAALVVMDGSNHTILDRALVHGNDWSLGYDPTHSTKGGVSARGTFQAVINSWVYDIDSNTDDGWAIGGGTGGQPDEGPLKLYNNLLAGASETWLFGGGPELFAYPHDFEFRRNLSMKPLKWMMARGRGCGGSGGMCVRVKNLGEFKYGQRVLYEDNVFMNEWEGQADQWGVPILLTPANQSNTTTSKRVNTSVDGNGKYTNVACASDASGTPCAAGTGVWGNAIVSMSRTGGIVTLTGANNGASPAWPYNYNPGQHIVLQGIPSVPNFPVANVNLADFNGEQTMGCLDNVNHTNCTSGYSNPRVIYFAAAGPDFPLTSTGGGIAQAFTASTCADTGRCRFSAPSSSYPQQHIAAVIDTEHITTTEDLGVQTGTTHTTCYPGLAPYAKVQDVTIRHNYITHSNSIGPSVSSVISACADITHGVWNVSVHDNVADDIDAPAWTQGNDAANSHGATGAKISNGYADPTTWPHDLSYVHNTWAGMRGWPKIPASSNWGFAFNIQDIYGSTYFAGITVKDNIFPGPMATTTSGGNLLAGGVTAGFSKYLCNPSSSTTCSWLYKNNLIATALNGSDYLQQANTPYPATNPDSSPTCPAAQFPGGCTVTDFSGVFTSWGGGMGVTSGNDYSVTATYKGAASDGKDLGADITRWKALTAAVLPHFTFTALTTTAQSMTCTHTVYCEQQLTWSGGASPFVQWHLATGSTLPAGMNLANGDGYSSCQVNGTYSKNGTTGCAGWVWGTPTQTGSFSLTFQVEDAAHQKASVNLTLTVN